jgi:hypothetical protein
MEEEYVTEKVNQDLKNDFHRIQNILLNFNEDIKRKKYHSEKELTNSTEWFVFSLNKCVEDYKQNFSIAKKNNMDTFQYKSLSQLNYLLTQN